MKKRASLPVLMTSLLAFTIIFPNIACKGPSDEEIKSWIEIVDVETNWVSKYYQPWPPKLTLVPSVTFRVKNLSDNPLRYVNFNAIFRAQGEAEVNLGDNFLAAIRKDPIPPGGVSDPITLKSNFGVEGKNLDSFENNPMWRTYEVRIFAQTKGSRHVLLGEWPVSRKIDFKEPEPVGTGEKKKEEGDKERP